ncbi:unnamed protein product [Owenia fusiformis]|uniref:Leucine-rich repeat-containing protein 58 n=1 Tax=Owenia fusiformis TaxID=6347 RepID=A0A8S4PVJ4_OWEFU|nr:unnamed protein product [Owenia fusiformis]
MAEFWGNSQDLSYSELDSFPEFLLEGDQAHQLQSLQLDHNQITVLPRVISAFANLITLDVSNNGMTYLSPELVRLQHLRTFIGKNNYFENESIPKDFGLLRSLEVVNISGNQVTEFPMQFTELHHLKCLYLGSNNIRHVPNEIRNLIRLEILYMGGNKIKEIPAGIGNLVNLQSLVLCDNRLHTIPPSLGQLTNLKSLSLHHNDISLLPLEIVKLDLIELSLRNNPLVNKFIKDLVFQPPSLLELAGRSVKLNKVPYSQEDLPPTLLEYLDMAKSCINPKCKGVYFTSKVEHVKFVDFCGKFRIPLLQYLCSPSCSTSSPHVYWSSESDTEDESVPVNRMKKVLLG